MSVTPDKLSNVDLSQFLSPTEIASYSWFTAIDKITMEFTTRPLGEHYPYPNRPVPERTLENGIYTWLWESQHSSDGETALAQMKLDLEPLKSETELAITSLAYLLPKDEIEREIAERFGKRGERNGPSFRDYIDFMNHPDLLENFIVEDYRYSTTAVLHRVGIELLKTWRGINALAGDLPRLHRDQITIGGFM